MKQTPQATGRRWASPKAAAEYAAVSLSTLRRLVRSGAVPAYKPRGGRALIDLDELDAAIGGGPAAAKA